MINKISQSNKSMKINKKIKNILLLQKEAVFLLGKYFEIYLILLNQKIVKKIMGRNIFDK
tara:strand:+ start:65 stop:244 length:180 start_codon:yes stop_codon:yes gene_type:complete